jgi:hypothetical protein
MSRPTDHACLDLTQLNLDVAFGKAGGKVIWQPRILAWFSDREFDGRGLPAPYTGMAHSQLYRALGVSQRCYTFNSCFVAHEDPAVRVATKDLNATDYQVTWETPVGRQVGVFRRSPNTFYHGPLKYPVADESELKVAAWRQERTTWSWDPAAFDRESAEWAGLGAPTQYVPRVNIQKLMVEDMGVEGSIYALTDYPATVERYFQAVHLCQQRYIEVLCASPIRIINFGDNIHSGVLSPRLFEKYVLPEYQWRNEVLHRHAKFTHAHWDGDCKPLLQYARDTGLDGIEAITPIPQGDVTLEETKAALGDMFLLDGIPAIYFNTTYSEQELIECAKRCIDLFAPHLVLGISDEMSSAGQIERIRLVTKVVDDYNASL